ncbi:bifunctional alpha/beta hydrolase/OsmC family protein [Flagellimonas nanhaiensis]|uniref:OsmC family protein n=1 Tax=Flagellimonas nanhaiensis TaxID=2292706 RepID=A0A371JTR6_9FLAO|nr:bifunctional alpha/beta hydrolase/OsmC family protein [Allomuricauda nanhaiensis]RDY61188.1 OsmC family protein [Allomuricauda nanhaiensis]
MSLQKVNFKNKNGENLVGRLELPADRHPHNFAIFAHCFTCTKNLLAVKNISKALTANGFAVLRFDFTGLGESEGDFSDTNFSGNVEDLVAAADFLKENYSAPTLLIGHSLGGAAAIFAAQDIPSISAVATIGAPSNPVHVKHLLQSGLDEIQSKGEAVVNLGGRDFKIKQQFIQDLQEQSLPKVAKNLRKPLLILHSPQDITVEIKNAEEIYVAAHHPKSFVSLDGADHLLSNKKDSAYVGEVISGWAKRYLLVPEKVDSSLSTKHQVIASLDGEDGYTTQMKVGNHHMIADEPESFGGSDFGPSPYEFLSAGLSACTVMTIQMYARRKGWPVDNVEVHTSYDKSHAEDCQNCEEDSAKIDTFHREIKLTGNLDEKQKKRIMQIADKCPVHKTLHSEVQVLNKLVD